MHGDFVWSERYITDLVDGAHWEDLGNGKMTMIESSRPTYYEQRSKGHDMGDPEMMLDAIQLDMAMDRMTDRPAKLALLAKMHGWDVADIGATVRDRRRRTGAELVESAVKAIARHERRRAGR